LSSFFRYFDDFPANFGISLNVPVVYDVFAARISETVGFAGLQKCGGTKHHKGRSSA
jgi:hypothetical protein